MRTIPFEGKHLRVWSRAELERVRQVDPSGPHVRGSGEIRVAADGTPVVVLKSACHPTLTLVNNPSHLVVEYHKATGTVVTRCHICGAPVMAFEVV